MYIFFLLSAVTLCTGVPRTPRIYNVLISTKKNLAPSQALPVYEPVLRTTSLGLAFSPLIYTPISTIHSAPSGYVHEGPVTRDITKAQTDTQSETKESVSQNDYAQESTSKLESGAGGGLNLPKNVLPIGQYVPYYTPFSYEPYYPKEEQPSPVVNQEKYYENTDDPKQIVANLKRNPDIPDVPPPPLPVKT